MVFYKMPLTYCSVWQFHKFSNQTLLDLLVGLSINHVTNGLIESVHLVGHIVRKPHRS